MSYTIGKMSAPLATWKFIFLILGAVTMGFGILLFFASPDAPSKAWFFNVEEKKAAVVPAAKNQTGVKTQQASAADT